MPPRAPLTDQVIVAVARRSRSCSQFVSRDSSNFERRVLINAWQRTADVPGGLGPRGQEDRRAAEALPPGQYDFRPDAGGRSLGGLGRAPARGGALRKLRLQQGSFPPGLKPPGLARPKKKEAVAPG